MLFGRTVFLRDLQVVEGSNKQMPGRIVGLEDVLGIEAALDLC